MLIFMVNTMHVRSNERTTFYSGELNVTPYFLCVSILGFFKLPELMRNSGRELVDSVVEGFGAGAGPGPNFIIEELGSAFIRAVRPFPLQ